MRNDGIHGWARGLALIDVCLAIYVAVTGNAGVAVVLASVAALIFLMGLWSRRTHRRYGEDNWRTSWPALFRALRGGRRSGSIS
jgi:hypothetical protein